LPLFTLALGLLDGFNPCAMWVLLFLLSLLVRLRDRKRMALIAGTFVLVSGAVYYAFMAAWLNVFLAVGLSKVVRVLLGTTAVLIGLINVKDFVAWGRGPSLSIPDAAKPGLVRPHSRRHPGAHPARFTARRRRARGRRELRRTAVYRGFSRGLHRRAGPAVADARSPTISIWACTSQATLPTTHSWSASRSGRWAAAS
jgi:hypothetical protein